MVIAGSNLMIIFRYQGILPRILEMFFINPWDEAGMMLGFYTSGKQIRSWTL